MTMAISLPTRGQRDWDDELNNALQQMDASAETAKATAAAAISAANEARNVAQSVQGAVIGTADAAVANLVATESSAVRANLRAPMRAAAGGARGGVVFQLDDGSLDHYTLAAPILESVGGRGTFAIQNTAPMSAAQLRDLQARGHEIAAHSATHANFTAITAAQRVTEWESSRTYLEQTCGLGAGSVTTFVYPVSAHSLAIDRESYLRWERTFSGENMPYIRGRNEREHGIAYGRLNVYGSANMSRARALIRRAATHDEFVTLITHKIDGTDASFGLTTAEFTELVQLAASLGVPLMTAKEAFPAATPVIGADFLDMEQWPRFDRDGTNTVDPVVDTQQAGYPGTISLKVTSSNTTLYPNAVSRVKYPYLHPGAQHVFSCRFRQDKTSGAGGGYIAIREYDSYGVSLGDLGSGSFTTVGTTPWQQMVKTWTPNPLAQSYSLIFASSPMVGSAYFAHPHVGLSSYGALG